MIVCEVGCRSRSLGRTLVRLLGWLLRSRISFGVTSRRGLSVRARLFSVAVAVAVAFAVVGGMAWVAAARVGDLAADEHRVVNLREAFLLADVQVAFLRGQAYETVLAGTVLEQQRAGDELNETLVELEELQTVIVRDTPADLLADVIVFRNDVEALIRSVQDVSRADELPEPEMTSALGAIDVQFDSLNEQLGSVLGQLRQRQDQAILDTAAARRLAAIAVIGASIVGLLIVVALLQRSVRWILRGLRGVSNAAAALAAGDLTARVHDGRRDEIGAVGLAFNATAESMQDIVRRLAEQGRRDAFARELSEALEMADSEEVAYGVIARSMAAISDDHRMELLLADSSRAHLERRVEHPNAGAAGCAVESPFACVAVRRGSVTTFSDSQALNACPNLRAPTDAPCSAVCVPVTFMGRALGVLHTTAAVGSQPDTEEVARLTTVATAAGVRIGTVRAFDQNTLQATTDVLTGLANRRSFESSVRRLQRQHTPFALVMADLDNFKLINDTHGHETGDRALVRFAHQLRHHLRADDLVARYGGEEFVIVLQNTTAEHAVEILTVFRQRLAEATSSQPPAFTASFGVTDTSSGHSLAELLRHADSGLYLAKARGRNQAVIEHGPAPDSGAMDRAMHPAMSADALDDLDLGVITHEVA